MALCSLDPHEQMVLDNVEHFNTTIFRGAGWFETVKSSTRFEARQRASEFAEGQRRKAMVYAVFGPHQALIETIEAGEVIMKFILVSYTEHLKDLSVTLFTSAEGAQAAVDILPETTTAFAVADVASLAKAAGPKLMLDIYNRLRPEGTDPVAKFKTRDAAAEKLFSLLSEKAVEGTVPDAEAVAAALAAKEAAKPARKVRTKKHSVALTGKPVRKGSSLANILTLMIAGKYTMAQIVEKSGVVGGVVDAEGKVLHRIKFVLAVQHGVDHNIDVNGIVTAVLPKGFTAETMIVEPKAAAPKAEKPAKAPKIAKEPKVKAEKPAKAPKADKEPKVKVEKPAKAPKAAKTTAAA